MISEDQELKELGNYLSSLKPGPIRDSGKIVELLEACWSKLDGSDEGGMEASKLSGRMEDISWDPPILSFRIERHGGFVLGSTRAELQEWSVDIENKSASLREGGYKQLIPRAKPLDVKPLAEEIAHHILQGKNHPAINRITATKIMLKIAEIIPSEGVPKQTFTGRRKRFKKALHEKLKPQRWSQRGVNVWERPPG